MSKTISKENLYYYLAHVDKVYDGDTVTLTIDYGFHLFSGENKIRLARINAPELRGEEHEAGVKSRDFLRELILGKDIMLETRKDKKGKYGRYIAEIWLEMENGYENVNDMMVENGFAEYKKY